MGKGEIHSCASGQEQVVSPREENIKLQLTKKKTLLA